MDCFKDKKTEKLFDLQINPNIDEIAREDVEYDQDADIEDKELVLKKERFSHDDVFEEPKSEPLKKVRPKASQGGKTPKPKPRPKPKPKQPLKKVSPKASEGDATPPKVSEEDTTPHVEMKIEEVKNDLPPTYREVKKLERQKQKEEEKERKRIEKEKHREIMKEKNRSKARERYYRIKEQKQVEKESLEKEIPKKIVEETKSNLNTFQKRDVERKVNKQNDIDFVTFTNYMMKYEDLKQKFYRQKEEEEKQKREKQRSSPHPENYPTSLLYGNRNKRKNIFY